MLNMVSIVPDDVIEVSVVYENVYDEENNLRNKVKQQFDQKGKFVAFVCNVLPGGEIKYRGCEIFDNLNEIFDNKNIELFYSDGSNIRSTEVKENSHTTFRLYRRMLTKDDYSVNKISDNFGLNEGKTTKYALDLNTASIISYYKKECK